MTRLAGLATVALSLATLTADAVEPQIVVYQGPCDASAVAALDAEHFVVGTDEMDTLLVYRRGQSAAVGSIDLTRFLGTKADEESDIEGAAAIGGRIYWVTSHGSNSKGKTQHSRHRFFATDIVPGKPPSLKPVGEPYTKLLRDMGCDQIQGYLHGKPMPAQDVLHCLPRQKAVSISKGLRQRLRARC